MKSSMRTRVIGPMKMIREDLVKIKTDHKLVAPGGRKQEGTHESSRRLVY